jgi:hypothetical protein
MKRSSLSARRLALATLLALLLMPAAESSAASLVGTTTSAAALESASRFYVHYASGYYWVAYHNGTRPMLFSSRDAATWASQGAIFSSFNPPANQGQWAVRFQGTNIIALGFNTGNTNRYYRNGTLNGDGTVTWNAADAIAQASATLTPFNALIANQKPVYWRSTATGTGQLARGSQLNGPAWGNLPLPPAALSTVSGGGFSAGALFATGGTDPDDLILLRATTQAAYAAGSHRLVSLKFDSSLNTHDGAWYNVSTLNGGLTEDATTEVKPGTDVEAHLRFAAVRDTSGNLHAVYVNRNDDVAHYRKAVGFNDTWSRVSSDVTQTASVIDRVALAAVANDNLYLFYSKSDGGIYYRRFDGASWGAESTLKAASATPLQGALAPMESADGCSLGLAWTEGTVSPYNVMFSLGIGSCSALGTVEGAGTITVTAPASFEMRFNQATGGGIDQFYDLAEDPGKANDLAGGATDHQTLLFEELLSSGNWYDSERGGSLGQKLDLLESTPTRVRVREESFFKADPTTVLPGLKAVGDYSLYPSGRAALRWSRSTTVLVPFDDDEVMDLVVHRRNAPDVLSNWATDSQSGLLPQPGGQQDYLLAQIEQPGARTDFLIIRNQDWALANQALNQLTLAPEESLQLLWDANVTSSYPVGFSDVSSLLLYFKPTSLVDHTDSAVISRSADYRTPATPVINGSKGSQWQDADENTGTAGDFYNESEAAYEFNLDPALGLDFNLDGTTTTRYSPFFKIRQWRSAAAPPTITVDGVTRSRDVDYRSDVKPVTTAVFMDSILWHSTLENAAALTGTPDIGTGGSAGATTTTYQTARYGAGLRIQSNNDWFNFPTASGFDKAAGAVDFWFQPTWDSTDGIRHDIGGFYLNVSNQFLLQKLTDNTLRFTIVTTGGTSDLVVAPTAYSWRAYDWVHIIIQWDDSLSLANQQVLYVNGARPAHTNPTVDYNSALLTPDTAFYLGNISNIGSGAYGDGIYDEVYSYSLSAQDPSSGILAHGGLTTNPAEFLASPTNNATLSLNVVNGTRQGEYLMFAADSRFRGLNVVLATAGAGTANLQWQFWNGTAWANLEAVTGFTDTTSNLTRNGNVFWTADPPNWSPSSFAGGPDLYYVRAYVASGSYTTNPVESRITTDILLFQYCGDVTTNAHFVFGPAVATAVTLMSFSAAGADSAVDLSWQTGSELENLGFNLYRGLSDAGPWTRITSSLIPGLGSSPLGATYTWRDTGLVNGQRFFYRLEDVDTHSVSTFHGPVSAVPEAGAASASGDTGDGGSGAGGTGAGGEQTGGTGSGLVVASGSEGVDGLPWCSWTVSGDPSGSSSPSSPPAYPCVEKCGDPSAVVVRVVSRTLREADLELETGGFYAIRDSSGGVRLSLPGFEDPLDPHAAALPWKRVVVEAPVGRGTRLGSVSGEEETRFGGLRLEATGYPEMEVRSDGTVLPSRRGAELRASGAVWSVARVLGESFQGETKRVSLELDPLRWDAASGEVVLTKRLRVRVNFVGAVSGETGSGTRGRRSPRSRPGGGETLAYLYTTAKGLYGVSFESLFPGRSRGLSVSSLGLHRQGEEVRFHVEPESGVFGPGSVLYFWADREPASTAYSGEVSWELVRETGGEGMEEVEASPFGDELTTSSEAESGFAQNRIYQSGLLEAEDLWQWEAVVGGSTKLEGVDLEGVDLTSPEPGHLTLELQGGSDAPGVVDHHVRAYVNGVLVREGSFDGKVPYRLEGEIPAGVLREGANDVSVENVGDTGVYSLVFLDRFTVSYPQTSEVREGRFEGEWSAGGIAQIGGVLGAVLPSGTTPTSPSGASGGTRGVALGPTSGGGATSLAGSSVLTGRTSGAPNDRGLTRAPSVTGSAPGSRSLVRSLTGVAALDVTDPENPLWLYGLEPGSSTVRLRVESGRRYALVSPEGVLSPRVSMPLRSSLKSVTNQADYVLIAPAAFLPAAEPLLERRRSQGLVTKAVSLEEIASVFGYGESSGEAIRAFLTYAYQNWARPSVKYVVLLGDASQDPRDFTGTAAPAPLPALFVKTSYLVTASDPELGAVNGEDTVPDLAIGRIPAQTVEEAQALVSKLLTWEDTAQGLSGEAVLVADNPDAGGNFEWDVQDIAASYLGDRATQTILLSQEGANTRTKILEALDGGASLISYVGHGGAAVWASENVLNTWDAESLLAQSTQPVMVTLDCLNGYFVAPNFDSLAEAFLKAGGRGTIAAFAPSGLSLDEPAHLFHRALMKELVSGGNERLGDAVLKAQEDYAETGAFPELLTIYQLLGDPAMKIQ